MLPEHRIAALETASMLNVVGGLQDMFQQIFSQTHTLKQTKLHDESIKHFEGLMNTTMLRSVLLSPQDHRNYIPKAKHKTPHSTLQANSE